MKYLLCALLLAASCHAMAECENGLPLHGVVTIDNCDARGPNCVRADKALYEYMESVKDDPAAVSVGITASPWHFYDADMHILSVEELAARIRPLLAKDKGLKRVVLLGSWTGVAPTPGGKSLAQRLSAALDGFPVQGEGGFLWIAKDGSMRTTNEAFSVMRSGPYGIAPGAEVMVSFVAGWPATMSAQFVKAGNAEGIMLAGVGWEVFTLCPEQALQAFEAAARLSNAIAAYNAAVMLLERGHPGDAEAAMAYLSQAAGAGDKNAATRLEQLRHGTHPQGSAAP